MTKEEEKFYRTVGEKVLDFRTTARYSQEKLGEKIGIQGNTVHRYETAKVGMSLFSAAKIAKELNTSIEALIPKEYIHLADKTATEREAEEVFCQLSAQDQAFFLRQMKAILKESA